MEFAREEEYPLTVQLKTVMVPLDHLVQTVIVQWPLRLCPALDVGKDLRNEKEEPGQKQRHALDTKGTGIGKIMAW